MTQSANLDRDQFGPATIKAREGGVGGTVALVILAVSAIIALVGGRIFLYQPFNIPSGSLIPTLLIGDYVFVSKFSYGYSHFSLPAPLDQLAGQSGRLFAASPKRGDMVVFKLPRDGQTDYIKRVIGLPGDKIQMIHGRLSINGEIVERKPLPPYVTTSHFGGPVAVAHYEETLPGGVKHEIIQLDGDGGFLADTPVFEVPPGNYFMVGDNRDNSMDSRVPPAQGGVGYVPFDNLVGRADIIFLSLDGADVRWSRIFQPVK
jgi:signal peptidase I